MGGVQGPFLLLYSVHVVVVIVFCTFQTKFNKSYDDPAEDKRRFDLYQESVGLVNAHNEKYKKGEVSYELGINHFSDLTPEERSRRTGKLSLPKKD